ncbi:MAG: HIT domain-containing protein [Planctomycetota bacterium]
MSTPSRKNLWAPWRIDFMRQLSESPDDASGGGCFFCDCAAEDASDALLEDQMVLHRTEHAVLLLNRYPYVNGHLLVAPRKHVADLSDLPADMRHGVMDLISLGADCLKRAMNCQGYNVGFNVGKCAGAAVPGHVHAHIVPRWHGDTNFMEMLGGVKVIPQALEDCYADLKRALAETLAG